ncbi:MAG: hypothetical protein AAGA80_13580, partial [Cyanobacteria bacterium P01_F01_bin.143]
MNGDRNTEQKGNFGIGQANGAEISGNSTVAGEIIQSNVNLDIHVNSPNNSGISPLPLDRSLNSSVLFEIKISGELTNDQEAKYK